MHRSPIPSRPLVASALLLALALAFPLAGCSRTEPPTTVGDKVGAAAERLDAKAEAARVVVEREAGQARAATGQAAASAAQVSSDAAITLRVKAGLAADSGFASSTISVETRGGRTVLEGKVADGATRDRATQVAAAIDGVSSVDNRLVAAN